MNGSLVWTIWGRPNCIWCKHVVDFLTEQEQEIVYIELNPHTLERFNRATNGAKTVPQVFYDDDLLGGYENTVEFYKMITEREVMPHTGN